MIEGRIDGIINKIIIEQKTNRKIEQQNIEWQIEQQIE